jgi:hypothetical protein
MPVATGTMDFRKLARSAQSAAFAAAIVVALGACGGPTSPNALVNIPTDAPTTAPTARTTPKPAPKPTKAASFYKPPGWDGYSDLDCPDFDTHAHAQSFFVGTGGSKSNDPYRLDADHDGIACE